MKGPANMFSGIVRGMTFKGALRNGARNGALLVVALFAFGTPMALLGRPVYEWYKLLWNLWNYLFGA